MGLPQPSGFPHLQAREPQLPGMLQPVVTYLNRTSQHLHLGANFVVGVELG